MSRSIYVIVVICHLVLDELLGVASAGSWTIAFGGDSQVVHRFTTFKLFCSLNKHGVDSKFTLKVLLLLDKFEAEILVQFSVDCVTQLVLHINYLFSVDLSIVE